MCFYVRDGRCRMTSSVVRVVVLQNIAEKYNRAVRGHLLTAPSGRNSFIFFKDSNSIF